MNKFELTNDLIIRPVDDSDEDGLTKRELSEAIRNMISARAQEISKKREEINQAYRQVESITSEINKLNELFVKLPYLDKTGGWT